MKRWMVIALIAGALLLLIVRAIYMRTHGSRKEKEWYPKNLGYQFSATVDSLRVFSPVNGLVFFHATVGEPDLSMEDRVNKKLKFNRSLRFILKMRNGALAFHARDLNKYQVGDSLVIQAITDQIAIYRAGKLTSESAISKALSGRLF